MANDLDALRRDNPVSSVVGRYVRLAKDGPEFRGLCPFHLEKTPSFTVNDDKGFYHCFGCGAHGDQFDFVMRHEGLNLPEACERLGSSPSGARPVQTQQSEPEQQTLEPVEASDDDLPIVGEPIKVWNPKRQRWPVFIPAAVFTYRTDLGDVIGAVIRVDTAPGHKITPQIRLARLPDGTVAWALWSFDRPRPLYGLELLGPDEDILLVEGEKCCESARRLFPHKTVMTWPGGTGGVGHVDWSPLAGRNVLIWPDADAPGIEAARKIAAQISHTSKSTVRLVDVMK